MTTPKKSIWKGALAGLAGGLAGAAAKAYLERLRAPRLVEAQVPLTLNADGHLHETRSATATRLSPDVSPTLAPWIFGGLAGAAYGAVLESEPGTASWRGAAFGLAMARLARATAAPAVAAVAEETRMSGRVTHAVFGIVTEVVRRAVRRGLA